MFVSNRQGNCLTFQWRTINERQITHEGEAPNSCPVSPEEDVYAVDVAAVQADGVGALRSRVLEAEEVVGHLGRAGHLAGTVQAQHQQVHHQPVVLHDERGKLQPSDDAVRVGVVHVLEENKTQIISHKLEMEKQHGVVTLQRVTHQVRHPTYI